MLFMKTSQTVKQLIALSVLLYRASLSRVIVVSFIGSLITALINQVPKTLDIAHTSGSQTWLVVIMMIVSVLIVCSVAIIIMHQMMALGRGEPISLGVSISFALPRIPGLTMAMVLIYFMMAIGMVLFVIPGLIVVTLTSMVIPLVIFKQLNPFAAIKASAQLVWGNAWRTFGVIITPNAVMFLLLTLAKLLHLPALALTIVEVVVMTAIIPWVYAATLMMYNELMMIHYAKQSTSPGPD